MTERTVEVIAAVAVAATIFATAQELLDGPFKDASPMMRATVAYPMYATAVAALCAPVAHLRQKESGAA